MDWFLYDNGLRLERVNPFQTDIFIFYFLKSSENQMKGLHLFYLVLPAESTHNSPDLVL